MASQGSPSTSKRPARPDRLAGRFVLGPQAARAFKPQRITGSHCEHATHEPSSPAHGWPLRPDRNGGSDLRGGPRRTVAYALGPSHSCVTFEVRQLDTATLRGRVGPLSGEVTLDREAGQGRVQLVINLATFSTGVPVLDARLHAPDMLASTATPQAFFVADTVRLKIHAEAIRQSP